LSFDRALYIRTLVETRMLRPRPSPGLSPYQWRGITLITRDLTAEFEAASAQTDAAEPAC